MIKSLLFFLQEKPQAGMKGTLGSLTAGITPTVAQLPKDEVIFWFQVIAFTVTIIAGILTACATVQKMKKNKNR